MAEFFFRLEAPGRRRDRVACDTLEAARNEAVRYLGTYLSEHPGFASEGHWRVVVENAAGDPYLNVIVATVTPGNAVPIPS